jgi:S1-C subfamily serine protease
MTNHSTKGTHGSGSRFIRGAALFILVLVLAAPSCPQTDPKHARESLVAIQHQIDTVEDRLVKSTVALQLGGVSGSGVIISPDGYVLTAAHVIAGRQHRRCTVILSDGKRLQATVLGSDREDDFGLIKIQDAQDLTVAPLGDSAALRPGEWVIATGHPLGLHEGRPPLLRIGRVLGGPRRNPARESRRILTDTPLISGDSGGPLFDLTGHVVGINSMITDGGRALGSIHVPANLPKAVLTQLENGDEVTPDDVQNAPITRAIHDAEAAMESGTESEVMKAASQGVQADPSSVAARVLLARANARTGKESVALASLQQAVDRGFVDSDYLRQEPDFAKLRGQSEYQKMVTRLDIFRGIPGTRKGDRSILAAAAVGEPGLGRGVVGVFSGDSQVSLGTVMSADGDILTKASELPEGPLTCKLPDGATLTVVRRGVDSAWDVALLKVKASGLSLLSAATRAEPGHWTFTPDASGSLAALGMVGVADMPVIGQGIASKPTSKAYMGVQLAQLRPESLQQLGLTNGVGVAVEDDKPAAQAGMKNGDVIYEVDGKPATDPDGLMDILLNKKPGDNVTVRVARDKEKLTLTINLTTRPAGLPGRGGLAEMLSGEVSRKAGPFPHVVHHDAVLPPKAMGGPVLDSEGKLIGLNIARADRTSTYAIASKDLSEIYAKLKAGS